MLFFVTTVLRPFLGLNTVVSSEWQRWKGPKGDTHWRGVVGVERVLSADMGYVRRGLQEGERGGTGESSMVGVVRREW